MQHITVQHLTCRTQICLSEHQQVRQGTANCCANIKDPQAANGKKKIGNACEGREHLHRSRSSSQPGKHDRSNLCDTTATAITTVQFVLCQYRTVIAAQIDVDRRPDVQQLVRNLTGLIIVLLAFFLRRIRAPTHYSSLTTAQSAMTALVYPIPVRGRSARFFYVIMVWMDSTLRPCGFLHVGCVWVLPIGIRKQRCFQGALCGLDPSAVASQLRITS